MSWQKRKGTVGENGVLSYISLWFKDPETDPETANEATLSEYTLRNSDAESKLFPAVLSEAAYEAHEADRDVLKELYEAVVTTPALASRWADSWAAEGIPFRRITSEGSHDVGDLAGPFTAIEVKNFANPPEGALLNNAEWKGGNSGKPYWFLVFKAKGRGASNIGSWHTLMTVEELVEGFGIVPEMGATALYAALPGLCESYETLSAEYLRPAPRRDFAPITWTPTLHFSNMRSAIPRQREQHWGEIIEALPESPPTAPFLIYPRRGQEGQLPPQKWYVYTTLHRLCRVLESLGVLPQDAKDEAYAGLGADATA